MMVSNGPLHSTLIEDGNPVLNAAEWHEYSQAAVKRQQQLASLNQRLSRLLEFANDVGGASHEHPSNSYSHVRNNGSVAESRFSPSLRSRSRSNDALTANLFEAKSAEAEIEEKTRIFRSSVQLYDVRIEELMRENAELRISTSETEAELQEVKKENEKLRAKNRDLRISVTSRPIDHHTCQESIKSLQQENRKLKARLGQHKQLLRNGLNDFISRSAEALRNGTPLLTDHERHIYGGDLSKEGEQIRAIPWSELKSKSTARDDLVPREQVAQLEDELKALADELEHERFCSKRKINRLQEKSDKLWENLRRKEAELQKTIGELETTLEVLQTLISVGDETQKELDVYRCLVEEEESRLLDSSEDSSGFPSSPSILSFRSSSSCSQDSTIDSCGSLEIEKHDVRRGKYIVLQNKGEDSLDISRWYIVHQCGNKSVTHRLPAPFVLKAKSRVVMWSADVETSHISPLNYVMSDTVLPWCESGEVDVVTKIYDLLGNVVSRRKTRKHNIRGPGILDEPEDLPQAREAHSCTLS